MPLFRIISGLILAFSIFMHYGCQSQNIENVAVPALSGKFDFTVLKAGQADAILMQTENNSIILDCGEKDDGDELAELLQEKGISNVDYIFITHFDKDHIGGFPEVMENVTASNIVVPDYIGNNDEYEAYLETIDSMNLEITTLTEDTSFILDDVLFEISVPHKQVYAEGDNDFSLVISVNGGYFELCGNDDCIDANGNIVINGGTIKATNPTGSFSGNFGVIDPDGQLTVGENAKIILASGNGSERNLSFSQNTITVYCDNTHNADENIYVADSNGDIIFEYAPKGSFKAVLIALSEIKTGETYTITIGDETFETEIAGQSTIVGTQSVSNMRNFGQGQRLQ